MRTSNLASEIRYKRCSNRYCICDILCDWRRSRTEETGEESGFKKHNNTTLRQDWRTRHKSHNACSWHAAAITLTQSDTTHTKYKDSVYMANLWFAFTARMNFHTVQSDRKVTQPIRKVITDGFKCVQGSETLITLRTLSVACAACAWTTEAWGWLLHKDDVWRSDLSSDWLCVNFLILLCQMNR